MKRVILAAGVFVLAAAFVVLALFGRNAGARDVRDRAVLRLRRLIDRDPEVLAQRRTAVDRPGIRLDLTMPAAVAESYDAADRPDDPAMKVWNEVVLVLAGGPARPVLLRGRGAGSAFFGRKSFIVDLLRQQRFTAAVNVRKLFLLNQALDPHEFEMRFCNRLLRSLGLFPSYDQYARVTVNGDDRGLYLLVERPRDAIRRAREAVVSVVRLKTAGYEHKWAAPGIDPENVLRDLHAALATRDRDLQAERLAECLDLDALMTWTAFNSLVQNADSVDELFLFEVRPDRARTGRLGLVAWDYDDLQQAPAHPDNVRLDPLTWAVETRFEKAVLDNPLLHARYRDVLRDLLERRLPEATIRAAMADLRETLSRVDPAGDAERAGAMQEFERRLLARRRELLERLRG